MDAGLSGVPGIWAAVICRLILDAAGDVAGVRSPRHRLALQRQALARLQSRELDDICITLDLDAAAVRRQIGSVLSAGRYSARQWMGRDFPVRAQMRGQNYE